MGKGAWPARNTGKKYAENYDAIFRKNPHKGSTLDSWIKSEGIKINRTGLEVVGSSVKGPR